MEEQTPCLEWADKLPIKHPEDLSSSDFEALQQHLAQCPHCTQLQNSYNLMAMRIRALPPVKPLASFTPQFLEQRKKMLLGEQWHEDEAVSIFKKSKDQERSPLPGAINTGTAALVMLAILFLAGFIFQKNRIVQVEVFRAIVTALTSIPQAIFLPSLGFVVVVAIFIALHREIKSSIAQTRRALANPRKEEWQNWIAASVFALMLIVAQLEFLPLVSGTLTTSSSLDPSRIVSDSTDIITTSTSEVIGLSDGSYAFDTSSDRTDRDLKMQASELMKKGDNGGAMSLWDLAVGKDTNDAEALIYQEDQRVLASNRPHITIVIGVTLTGSTSSIAIGRDILQGAYIAQKEYNDGFKLNGGLQVCLLIANAGSSANNTIIVAQQIVQAAKQDQTIVGVMGWPFSSYAHKAIPVLASAKIPMVSPAASADDLTGISRFFFRVAPTNNDQAVVAANYAKGPLHARRVALFVDPNNSYSKSLADDFQRHFVTNNNSIVDTEQYTVKTGRQEIPALLQKALSFTPDLIYFSGYSDDLSVLLVNLPASQPNLQVLGGDALYQLNGYSSSARAGFGRLHFTAFAYPDEWEIMSSEKPLFFSEYPAAFNPAGRVGPGAYGYTRPDNDVILSYDATSALLQGCNNALTAGKNKITSTALRDGLAQINSDHPIQGVSGQIAFGSDGNPTNKAIVVLYVDPDGHIKLLENNGIQGCFRIGCG